MGEKKYLKMFEIQYFIFIFLRLIENRVLVNKKNKLSIIVNSLILIC